MQSYFFQSTDGNLFDTRNPLWAHKPLRAIYAQAFTEINDTQQLRATLRHGGHAWPGGYPMYFITSDGAALSFESVRENLRNVLDSIAHRSNDGWRVVAGDVNWENDDLTCDHSSKRIPSAYGEAE
jgi:hypothetical protein